MQPRYSWISLVKVTILCDVCIICIRLDITPMTVGLQNTIIKILDFIDIGILQEYNSKSFYLLCSILIVYLTCLNIFLMSSSLKQNQRYHHELIGIIKTLSISWSLFSYVDNVLFIYFYVFSLCWLPVVWSLCFLFSPFIELLCFKSYNTESSLLIIKIFASPCL